MTNQTVTELIERSNRLGADKKNTNYAGGNTSAKGVDVDPVTGEEVELVWVKGSGGDLGTLTEAGLAALRLDRMRALVNVYPGVEREDEMVAAFDYCLHGKGGAAPSIDTAMHGLVDAAHVDHLHPDAGIAIATAADGEELTAKVFGDKVVWVPWRRPGFQLGLDIAAIKAGQPRRGGLHPRWPRDHGLGRHLRGGRAQLAVDHRHRGGVHRGEHEAGAVRTGARGVRRAPGCRAPVEGRRSRADDPRHRLARPADGRPLHRRRRGPRLPGVRRAPAARGPRHLAAPTTSCGPRSSRWCSTCRPAPRSRSASPGSVSSRVAYREDYQAYYDRNAVSTGSTAAWPAIRGADPLIVLVPGVGMFSFGKDKQTARVAGEFYLNAINVMRGAEGLSTYAPIDEAEKFRIEYWALEEAKLRGCRSRSRWRPGSPWSPARPAGSARRRRSGSPPRVPAW